ACWAGFARWGGGGGRGLPLVWRPAVTGGSQFPSRIGEFRPPLQGGYAVPLAYGWIAMLVVTALTFVLNFRRIHLGRLFTALVFGYLSTQALRNVALFAWVAVSAVAANVGDLVAAPSASRVTTRADRLRQAAGGGTGSGILARAGEDSVALLTVILIASVVTNRLSYFLATEREFGIGISKLHAPVDALAFASDVGIGGRPFNDFASGGYLAWARFPAERVFVDGRTQAYPEDFFRFYFQVTDDPNLWPEVVSRFAPDYALLYHVWSNRYPLVRYLRAGHGWQLVYYDETASLYLPTDDGHREVRERAIREFAARRSTPPPPSSSGGWRSAITVPVAALRRDTEYGDFLLVIGDAAGAADAYERALSIRPDASATRFNLAQAYWSSNRPEKAIVELRDLVRRDPNDARARAVL